MISIKMADLVNSATILQKLSGMSLKARLAWQIARLLKAADVEIQSFNETRMNMIKKYGEKDENGELITDEKGNCKIPPEISSQFTSELEDLLKTEVEINANYISFEDIENLDFTPVEMNQLEPFIDMNEE